MKWINGKAKARPIIKAWDQGCKSLGIFWRALMMRSRWRWAAGEEEERRGRKCTVAPEGCFSVYVGPQKRRFAVKTEYANHPLFQMLLEEAELEFGYNSQGPIALPCNVDIFYKVLVEMDSHG